MAHRTFFSFHYEKDVWRASNVRQSSALKTVPSDWIEASIWEEAKSKTDVALQKLIADALLGTSVTAVLIGSETASRRWVNYEIEASERRGNGLLGIYIHNIKDRGGYPARKGSNPLPSKYATYDWINDNGYANLGGWVDAAYDQAN